ncbi:MAG TPA: PDZ domain-containing protein [Acidimicrobiales bacterium]|nr:PDZ domain-containing protein [Acidimicrobiales bacterium]
MAFGLLVVILVGAATALASHYADGYFLFAPGTAPSITANPACKPSQGQLALPNGAPCVRLVVPKGKAHALDGKLLMVDVEVSQAGPWDWALYELGLLGGDRQMISVASYAGTTPTSELGCQDTQLMVSANEDAALAALGELHYKVGEDPEGAEVTEVLAGTPAWDAGLKCNDLITAVNGKPVTDAAEFTNAFQGLPPGSVVTLSDHPASGGRARTVRVTLEKTPPKMVALGFPTRAYVGLAVQTRARLVLPFTVSVNAGDIGGPSAGLAFTLAMLDALSGGKLTGGHVVAATGTIAPNGQVGDVGGVQEKAVAVEKAGAQVFFVPSVEYKVAKSVVGNRLRVVPVTTLAQVLHVLQSDYGGSLTG